MRLSWRRRRERFTVDDPTVTANARYERFVREFGPAHTLTDQQLAALVGFCADVLDTYAPTVVVELLLGRPVESSGEDDAITDEHPRVLRVMDWLEGADQAGALD